MAPGQWYVPPMQQQWSPYPGDTSFAPPSRKGNAKQHQLPDKRKQQRPQRGAGGDAARGMRGPQGDGRVDVTPLYKTRLCSFFANGACERGSRCGYAHGEDDLWPSPDFERTSACPTMRKEGVCRNPNCRYAHSVQELRASDGLLKTKMCTFFLNGLCINGQACRFAHSKEELLGAVVVQKSVNLGEDVSSETGPPPSLPDTAVNDFGGGAVEEKPSTGDAKPISLADALPDLPVPGVEESPSEPAAGAEEQVIVEAHKLAVAEEISQSPTSKLAVAEEFSQVALAMRKVLCEDDDSDAFADYNNDAFKRIPSGSSGSSGVMGLQADHVCNAERSTDHSSNGSGITCDQLSQDGELELKVSARNTFLCIDGDDVETVVRRRSKSR